ncbi:hypothetical protein [Pelagibacterium mangrovi]|uniref:hypothetical protein n=1 Tax=Pelagibacterium mangrovi TaxID=3119828 RepID=UPI002FC702EE
MTASQYWDMALRAVIVACTLGAVFLPLSELTTGDPRTLGMLAGHLIVLYLPLPACALLALFSPFIDGLKPYGALLDSLTALFAFCVLAVLGVYFVLAGLGVIALFFLLLAFFIPFFWDMNVFMQAGTWLLVVAFVLSLVQMVRSNRSRPTTL